MELPSSAWIYTASGRLFAPPFVSRSLLYHLRDIKHSLLVYHEPRAGTSGMARREGDLTMFDFEVAGGDPTSIFVHAVPSEGKSFSDLVSAPSHEIVLSKTAPVQKRLGQIVLNVTPTTLQASEMFMMRSDTGSTYKCQIAGTTYRVSTPGPIANLGEPLRPWAFRCWEVSVLHADGNTPYDLYSLHDWDLTASAVESDSQAELEMRLEKIVGLGGLSSPSY